MKELYRAHGSADIVFVYDREVQIEDQDPEDAAQEHMDNLETIELLSVERIYELDELPEGWTADSYPLGDDDQFTCRDILEGPGSYTDIQVKLRSCGYDVPLDILKKVL